jgi:predicted ABC-type ATPase
LSMQEKKLYIISGCNGAGKTTASFNILPELLNCKEFVNADEIARGLSPFQPENVSIEAGRLMLKRIDELINSNQDFSFETTLSTKSFINTIEFAKSKGYYVTLIFFWLESVELAKDRVRKRVSEGGHNIESDVIERRYKAGIKNLFKLYFNKVDSLLIYDNSTAESELIAEKEIEDELFTIHNSQKFNSLKMISNEQ